MGNTTFIDQDPWLRPYATIIEAWSDMAFDLSNKLAPNGQLKIFARGHHWYGLHRIKDGWVFRDWAPNATAIYLIGECNSWQEISDYKFRSLGRGEWELTMDRSQLKNGQLYALSMHWDGGHGKRIPAWCQRVVQDESTKEFNAQVWIAAKEYKWKNPVFNKEFNAPLIYESHIGMAGEEECVHTYNEFREKIIPYVKDAGYNTIQLMAIPEHPYYGSFGYHVSSFFAPSSRFGTPEELKALIDEAHEQGIAVIMDLVQSHAVRNEIEGLGCYDGTRYQFFHKGTRGEHPAWDSYCFNYGKNEVIHFLLSNIAYWMEDFHFDGFRFDGVTSMIYKDHGLEKDFSSYADYFTPNIDRDALIYLQMANQLIHQINPNAISIAEEVSGLPGLAVKTEQGGIGFDYRMAMGVPDFWIKLIKEYKDEDWDMGQLFYELTAKRADEKVVSYCESHDQALVGDKTIIFRLVDKEMYDHMAKDQESLIIDRGIALHKMIRLVTASCAGGAYLNFMGNEFGHPEWIDFPRKGNQWSYKYARRQWSLVQNQNLKFHWLADFDKEMIQWLKEFRILEIPEVYRVFDNKADQVLAFMRGAFLMIFNFNPTRSFTGYGIPLGPSKYRILFDTDEARFGGQDRVDKTITYYTTPSGGMGSYHYLNLYLPARTAFIMKKEDFKRIR